MMISLFAMLVALAGDYLYDWDVWQSMMVFGAVGSFLYLHGIYMELKKK